MPAIQPARLKIQTTALVQQFSNPNRLVKDLHELLDSYADRTRRPGKIGAPAPILHTYQVPTQVMRQIWRQLQPQVERAPDVSLALVDVLWREENLECRNLAILILGQIPATPPEPILARTVSWAESDIEFRLLDDLLTTGTARLRADAQDVFLRQIKNWLTSANKDFPPLGLLALIPIVEAPDFDNLPIIFRLIKSVTLRAPLGLRPYQLRLFKTLAAQSPQETAYFLSQNLLGDQDSNTASLVRGCLPYFSDEYQEAIRTALRAR